MDGNNNMIFCLRCLCFPFFVGSPLVVKSQNLVDGRTSKRDENSRKPMRIELIINRLALVT